MTNINFVLEEDRAQFIITGHARYAPVGQDIVCAGISALSFALCTIVRSWGDECLIRDWMVQSEGDMVHVALSPCTDPHIKRVLDSFVESYSQIAEQFPEYASVHIILP